MVNFVAIDVETANPDLSSICQIGIVIFKDGAIASEWQQLINPEDEFDPWNVSIHGIIQAAVIDAPTLPSVFSNLRSFLSHKIVVCHTGFDRVAVTRATVKYGLSEIPCIWLDSAKIVRRAWPTFAYKGYVLSNVAQTLGIVFDHHVAKEDARAAGEIVLRAINDTGIGISDWLQRVNQPILSHPNESAPQCNPSGPLFGEVIVFTGSLSIPRRAAAKLAADGGCLVSESVNSSTTLLIVGDQDIRRLAGHEKSSKHRKAESLMLKGQPLRILTETDFCQLLKSGE